MKNISVISNSHIKRESSILKVCLTYLHKYTKQKYTFILNKNNSPNNRLNSTSRLLLFNNTVLTIIK